MATAASNPGLWLAPRRWWSAAVGSLSTLRGKQKHPFDRAHGVDTGGLIYADPAAEGHAGDRHNAGYYATAPSLFHGAIALWRETLRGSGYALEDYTLVDIGCGKGRVLMLATEYGFREIVGVELNPPLARVARKNLRKWMIRGRRVPQVSILRPGSPVPRLRIIEGDALSLALPDGPVALFYFNSFEREMTEMWLAWLDKIARGRTAPLDLIYIHPEFDALVRQVPGMRAIAEADIPFSEEDAGADAFGVDNDRCAVYRLSQS